MTGCWTGLRSRHLSGLEDLEKSDAAIQVDFRIRDSSFQPLQATFSKAITYLDLAWERGLSITVRAAWRLSFQRNSKRHRSTVKHLASLAAGQLSAFFLISLLLACFPLTTSPPPSLRDIPAVNDQSMPSDPAGAIPRQEYGRLGDVLWPPQPAPRMHTLQQAMRRRAVRAVSREDGFEHVRLGVA